MNNQQQILLTVEDTEQVDMTVEDTEQVEMNVEDTERIIEGISPTVAIERVDGGIRITITDRAGVHSAIVQDGATGETGPQGPQGIEDKQGEQGPQGIEGKQGPQGAPGQDGSDYVLTAADKAEIAEITESLPERVTSLTGIQLNRRAYDAVGIPVYVADVAEYSAYGLTETGWYTFARIAAQSGTLVTAQTVVTGAAGYIATIGSAYVDVAVRFDAAALSQAITVCWGEQTEIFVFKATDLAIRNLDYLTTFYIYDISPYTTWTYVLTADATFTAGKNYYTLDPATGEYTMAEVTAGQTVPANTYYNHSKVHFDGMTKNVTYRLDEIVDCPVEIALPEVAEDGRGAWFEIQMRYGASYSCTLLPPAGVKIGTAQTQAQAAGINTIDLQYTDVDGVKMWTLLNTHSNIPS